MHTGKGSSVLLVYIYFSSPFALHTFVPHVFGPMPGPHAAVERAIWTHPTHSLHPHPGCAASCLSARV